MFVFLICFERRGRMTHGGNDDDAGKRAVLFEGAMTVK